jgi:hypothetical protein
MCGPQTVHSKQTHLHLQKPGLSKRERMTRTLKRYTFTAMLLIPVAHPRRLAPAVSAASVGEARVAHRRPLVPPRVTPSAPYPTSRRVAVQIGGGGGGIELRCTHRAVAAGSNLELGFEFPALPHAPVPGLLLVRQAQEARAASAGLERETSTARRRTTCHRRQRISMEDDPRRSALRRCACLCEAAATRCGDCCACLAPPRSGRRACLAPRSVTAACPSESALPESAPPRNTLVGVGGGGRGPTGMQRRLGRGDAYEARSTGTTRVEKTAR